MGPCTEEAAHLKAMSAAVCPAAFLRTDQSMPASGQEGWRSSRPAMRPSSSMLAARCSAVCASRSHRALRSHLNLQFVTAVGQHY